MNNQLTSQIIMQIRLMKAQITVEHETPFTCFLKIYWGLPGWCRHLRDLLLACDQVVISGLWDQAPCWALHWARNLLEDSLSLAFCPAPHPHSCLLKRSLSQINTEIFKKKLPRWENNFENKFAFSNTSFQLKAI